MTLVFMCQGHKGQEKAEKLSQIGGNRGMTTKGMVWSWNRPERELVEKTGETQIKSAVSE